MNKSLILFCCLLLPLSAMAQKSEYLDSLETSKAVAYNPADLIRGRIAGVRVSSIDGNVNGETNVNIRGINTLRGDGQPLWIVDGAILTTAGNQNADAFWQFGEQSYSSTLNTMAYLNPNEIESIEILKDMAATAIYGAAGANGVIIVKTKMPQNSENNIRYQGNVALGVSNMSAAIFAPSISHNHTVGVSGTMKGSSYNISAYYRIVDGIAENQGANYGGASINYETRANSALWFGFHSLLSLGNVSNITGPSYFGQPSLLMLGRNPYLFPDNSEQGWNSDYDDNADDARSTNSMFLTLNITPNFSLNATVGADYRNLTRKIWFGNGTSFGKDMNGAVSILSSSLFNYNASAVLAYDTFLGSAGKVGVKLGIDALGHVNRFNTMNGVDFFTHALRGEGLSMMGSKPNIHSFDTQYVRMGGYVSAYYDCNDYAGLNVLFREDSTPSYGGFAPEYYPSASAFLNLKKLALSSVDAVSSLKLDVGYGISGRETLVPYQLLDVWLTGDHFTAMTGQDCYITAFNRARSKEFTAGIDASFFDGRMSLGVKYFDKNTDEVFSIYDSSLLRESGYYVDGERREVETREASIANRGVEIEFGAIPVKSGKVKWSIDANLTVCANQITSVCPEETFGKKVGSGFYANANAVGCQIGQLYGFLENPDGSYLDVTRDGVLSEADKRMLGNTAPKYYGGLSSVLEIGSFSLDLLIDGAAGHFIANLNDALRDRRSALSQSYVESADFLRIGHVAAAYTIPFKAKWIKSMKLSATVGNLYTFSGYKGWNPDVNCFGRSVLSQGIDYGAYPITRNFILGVNLNF